MIKRIILGISILVITCLVPACGGEGTIWQSGGEYYLEVFEVDCAGIVECGYREPETHEFCVLRKASDECERDIEACNGRQTVEADTWQQCLQETEQRDCDTVFEGVLPSICRTAMGMFQ